MPANMTFQALKTAIKAGEIDTVITCACDMQGRLQGKRFHAMHFLDSAYEETHCCNYLLATDLEMVTVQGYEASSWNRGYGDYTLKPNLDTIRRVPWLPGTAMVMCDLYDHHGHSFNFFPANTTTTTCNATTTSSHTAWTSERHKFIRIIVY